MSRAILTLKDIRVGLKIYDETTKRHYTITGFNEWTNQVTLQDEGVQITFTLRPEWLTSGSWTWACY